MREVIEDTIEGRLQSVSVKYAEKTSISAHVQETTVFMATFYASMLESYGLIHQEYLE